MTFDTYEVKLPAWAVCYLLNGDSSGMEDDEVSMVDSWIENSPWSSVYAIYDIGEDEPSFTHYPAFGSACECYDCVIFTPAKK